MNIDAMPNATFKEVRGRLNGAGNSLLTLVLIMDDPNKCDSINMFLGNTRLIKEAIEEAERLMKAAQAVADKEGNDGS